MHKLSKYVKERTLENFNISFERHKISGILRDIASLSLNLVECNILHFQYSNQYPSMSKT
jgi:hypothetical protein